MGARSGLSANLRFHSRDVFVHRGRRQGHGNNVVDVYPVRSFHVQHKDSSINKSVFKKNNQKQLVWVSRLERCYHLCTRNFGKAYVDHMGWMMHRPSAGFLIEKRK